MNQPVYTAQQGEAGWMVVNKGSHHRKVVEVGLSKADAERFASRLNKLIGD